MMKTKSAEIAQILRLELEEEKYTIGNRFPSEGELAERFHIGTATANRAVSKLEDLGYLIRKGSRRDGMRVAATKIFPRGLIGFIMMPESEFHHRILAGACHCAILHGYAITPFPYTSSGITSYEKILSSGRFAGAVTLTQSELKIRIPVIYTDVTNLDHIAGLTHVRGDLRTGCVKMLHYLLHEQGCKNIVYFHTSRDMPENVPRRLAFIETLKKNGFGDPEKRIFAASEYTTHTAAQTLREMVREYHDIDAIVCENDEDALAIKRALVITELKNHKIIVTGFGNLKMVQQCEHFPTIEQHPEETGFRSVAKLIRMIEYPDIVQEKLEELPVELIL